MTQNDTKYQFSLFTPDNFQPDLVNLVGIFVGDIEDSEKKDNLIKFCEDRDEIISFLKNEYDGVYLDSDVFEYPYNQDDDITVLEYSLKVKNLELYEFIEQQINHVIFNNKKGLETIMSTKQAPYKLWTLEALKNECKQRQFDPSTYKDVKDKSVLVKILQSDDSESTEVKQAPAKEVAKKAPAKKTPPAPPSKKKEKELPPEETNDLDDLDEETEEVVEETEEVVEEAPAKKTTVKKPAAAKVESAKKESTKKAPDLSSVVNLNQKLRDANLWVGGCQFLSTEKKTMLLNSKTDKERKAIYAELEKKQANINSILSEKMKGKTIVRKAQQAVEGTVEKVVEEVEAKGEKEVVAPAKEKASTKKAPPVPPAAKKKLPPVPPKKK